MDKTGVEKTIHRSSRTLDYTPWMQAGLPAETFPAPAWSGLGRVQLLLKDPSSGKVLHHNVFHFVVDAPSNPDKVRVFEQSPAAFSAANWSLKQWQILDGYKVNGAGKGFFEYRIPVSGLDLSQVAEAHFLVEASSKPLLDKDRDKSFSKDQDYMLGARVSPHQNPNAYPMTDKYQNPSNLRISIRGATSQAYRLADDPADHRGVLSWHAQPRDRKLYEAGTFGDLIRIPVSSAVLKAAQQRGYLEVRLEADNGLAIYGVRFGRYPVNPSLVVRMK